MFRKFRKDEHYQINDELDGKPGTFWVDVLWGRDREFVTVRLLKRLVGNGWGWLVLRGDPEYRTKRDDQIYVANKKGKPRIK